MSAIYIFFFSEVFLNKISKYFDERVRHTNTNPKRHPIFWWERSRKKPFTATDIPQIMDILVTRVHCLRKYAATSSYVHFL